MNQPFDCTEKAFPTMEQWSNLLPPVCHLWDFAYTGIIKNQHVMIYWNLYHAPLKRVVFVIVAVLFAMQ